jgi:hypothetical protein
MLACSKGVTKQDRDGRTEHQLAHSSKQLHLMDVCMNM